MATQPLPSVGHERPASEGDPTPPPRPLPADATPRPLPADATPQPQPAPASPPPSLTEADADGGIPRPGGRQRAFAYLDAENAHRYRQLMGVLLANKLRFGLRLSPTQIATRLWDRFSVRYEAIEVLERDLTALCDWGACDRHQDHSRAGSTREFKRRRYTYDITAAGELAERAALAVDRLSERIGALERSQLPELLDALIALAIECERPAPRPAKLVARFGEIGAMLERLRADTSDFMRELGTVMADEQAIAQEAFERYKRRVIDHLQGFRSELRRLDAQFAEAIGRVESAGPARIFALAASSDEPPVWGLSDEEVAARRAERFAVEWAAVKRWFRGGAGEPPPWQELDRALGDAIAWIVQSAQRLIDRRSRRVDRAAEYRALASLFDRAPSTADCHALFAACFGLYRPRHFSVAEADPELTAPTCSWWQGASAPVQASLYRPGGRTPGAGRTNRLPDHTMARQALALRRAREREELARALERFTAAGGPLRLRALGSLDEREFRHLLGWLGRALSAAADAQGTRRAESQDGLVRLALRPPPPGGEPVEIATPNGTLLAPDYEIEVIAC